MKKTRGILIAGNWKMNHGPREVTEFFTSLKTEFDTEPLPSTPALQTCLIPSFISLETALSLAKRARFPIQIAAQNAHGGERGAFTGEVSGPMLKEIGIQTVLIGHSERRHVFGETLELIRQKTTQLLAQGFCVILCVGETRAEREADKTRAVLVEQIQSIFSPAAASQKPTRSASPIATENLVIAYEPVWAIGTGLTATPEQANQAHIWIREILVGCLGATAAARVPLLYGGSVTPKNIDDLLQCSEVDGALVGGASLKAPDFFNLLRAGARIAG